MNQNHQVLHRHHSFPALTRFISTQAIIHVETSISPNWLYKVLTYLILLGFPVALACLDTLFGPMDSEN